MNHRRSVAAVSILAAVAFAACGEADDAGTTTTNNNNEVEQSAAAEAQAHADALDAWAYYYDVTHPEPKAAVAIRNSVSADAAEHRANFEARVAEAARNAAAAEARGPVSADALEHRAISVTVEHEELRRGVDIKR